MEEINLKEVFGYFKSKLIWIAVAILAIVVIGNVFTLLTRVPLYQSNTTIVLANENKDYNSTDVQLNKSLIGTYSEIIKSRKVLSQVIDELKLKTTVAELSNHIVVTSIENTEIIKIAVSNEDSSMAAKITDAIAVTFAKEIKEIYHLENISIMDHAVKTSSPYNVNYMKDNLLYFVVGLVLSCMIVFVMYYFDTTIKSSEVVEEKLGLTVLGIVPKEDKE